MSGRGMSAPASRVASEVIATAAHRPVPLSVLDLSPVPSGSSPSRALHESVALARTVEQLGYHRIWFAEHHNIPSVTSTAPVVMIATAAAATSTIRVGSGGIMLPNHAPLAVAEAFRVLEGLHPGRIDLGLGRAPGTDQRTALALRRSHEALTADDFPEQYAELLAYVDGFPAGHPFAPVSAQPDDVPLPPVTILGSSRYGGQAAAALGTAFAYAGHFGGLDPAEALGEYRAAFRASPRRETPYAILAVSAIVAPTAERAEELARAADLSTLRLRSGRPGPLPSPQEAADHPWTTEELHAARAFRRLLHAGTPEVVAASLRAVAAASGADELMVTTNVHDPEERRESYRLLAREWGLHSLATRQAALVT